MNGKIFGMIMLAVLVAGTALLALRFQPTGLATLPEEGYTVKIGYKPNANYVVLFVALEKGYFEDEGLKVETLKFDSTNTIMDAFAAGHLDATPTGNVVVSYSLENTKSGLFKLFSPDFYTDERHSENLIVRKGSRIRSINDLEGKTIGANKGIFARTMISKFLEKQGVIDFKIIEIDDSLQLQALETGQIDALVSLEPNPTIAVEKGIAEYLVNGSVYAKTFGFYPSTSCGAISTKFLREHPAEAKKFLRAMKMSIEFITKNFEESKQILPKYIPIEKNIAEKTTFPEFQYVDSMSKEQKEAIQKTADFLFEEGIIKKKVDTSRLMLDEKDLE